MLISKFHKLIQSRLLWGAFLVIIVFSFVVWGTPFLFRSKADREAGAEGRIGGKIVSREEFRSAYAHVYAAIAMSMGRKPDLTGEKAEAALRQAAWRRVAALREAARLGFTASEQEVQQAIAREPYFQQEGRFSLELYKNFVGRFLGELGYTESFFEQHMSQELLLNKLHRLTSQTLLVPPADVERVFSLLQDSFKLEYTELKRDLVEKDVKVSPDAIKAFFDKDPARYTIPPKVRVKYVFIDHRPFLADLKAPSKDDIEDYYDEHSADFTVMVPASTNATSNAVASASTNEAPTMVKKTKPLDEVKDEIVARIRRGMAMNKAEQRAAEFVGRIAPDRQDKPLKFEDAAAAMKLEAHTTPPFAKDDPVPGVAAGPSFNQTAFELNPNPDEYFSSGIRGEEGCYVIGLEEKIAERIPKMDEVLPRVTEDAREAAVHDALMARARDLVAEAKKSGFAAAAAKAGVKIASPAAFVMADGLKDDPNAQMLMRVAKDHNEGEFADPVETMDDTLLVIRIAARKPADRGKLTSMHGMINDLLVREYENSFLSSYDESLLARGEFTDLGHRRAKEDAEENRDEPAPKRNSPPRQNPF